MVGLAVVLGVVFLAYCNTLGFDFVHDDRMQILGNTWLRSWKYLPRYFTADVWAFEHPVFRGTFYRPIFLLWFRLQYLVFGLKPWGWHLCTVLCHVGVTLLVYFTAARLLEDRLAALFTALIFGLHPAHADGVAWISGVTEPLFAFFLFASYLCYLKKRDDPDHTGGVSRGIFGEGKLPGPPHPLTPLPQGGEGRVDLTALAPLGERVARRGVVISREEKGAPRSASCGGEGVSPIVKSNLGARARIYLAASLFLYALACLSKETAVILPFIIFACEILWSKRSGYGGKLRAWVLRSVDALKVVAPYLVLVVIYMVARLLALHGFQNTKEPHTYLSMFLTWPSVLWFYIQHLFWPTRLNPFYSRQFYSGIDLHHVLLPAIPVLLAAVGLWMWSRRSAQAAVATIWLVIPILPVLNLRAFIEGHLVHDRYLYLPSFGFAMLVALGLRHLDFGRRIFGQPALQLGLAGVIALAMGIGVYQATACYANEATFFTYVTSMSPEGHSSQLDLAGLLGSQGHLEEAIKIYQQIWPAEQNNWDVNYNLGYAYYVTGRLADADHFLSRAVQIDASRPDGFFYLGLTKLKEHDINAAAANVQRAVIIRPDADHYHFALGVIFKVQGNLPAALSEFRQEMDLDQDNASAREQAQEIEAEMAAGQKGSASGASPGTPNSPAR